jgi:hypothetical protein
LLPLGQRVFTLAEKQSSSRGALSSFDERHIPDTPKPHFPESPLASIEKDPTPAAILGDRQIEAAPVGVTPLR